MTLKEHYHLQELLEDPSFRKYAEQPDSPEARKWTVWLNCHPHLQPVVQEAILQIKGVHFQQSGLPEAKVDEAWQKLEKQFVLPEQNNSPFSYRTMAAAFGLLLMMAAAWWWLPFFHRQQITTGYGETLSLQLNDGTSIILNANSSLSYDPRSLNSSNREVYLDGEAFFDVAEIRSDGQAAAFRVVSEAGGLVEVLGTTFNVQSRRNKTRVVLETGIVNFRADQVQMLLKPGEMAEYSGKSRKIQKSKVSVEQHSAWKEHQFIFNDTPLLELAQMLEDQYGLQVVFRNKKLSQKRISGTIRAHKAEQILTAVERIFSIQAVIRKDTVFISSYKP